MTRRTHVITARYRMFTGQTIAGAAEALRRGRATSAALVEASLDAIARWQPKTNAFVLVDADGARAAAIAADAERRDGRDRGPLHGIPISLKDLMKLPGRTVRAVTECAGNDAGFFDYQTRKAKKPSRINQQDMNARAAMREKNAVPSTEEISNESTTTCAVSAGEFTGVPLAEVLKKAGIKNGAVSVRFQGFDRGQPDLAVQYRSVGRSDFKLVDPGADRLNVPKAGCAFDETVMPQAGNHEHVRASDAPVELVAIPDLKATDSRASEFEPRLQVIGDVGKTDRQFVGRRDHRSLSNYQAATFDVAGRFADDARHIRQSPET